MTNFKKCIGLIPSRLASTRLPGKALADIHGMPLVVHTASVHAAKNLDDVYVCTDSDKIAEVCKDFNIKVIMTLDIWRNGTEIAEAASNVDFVVDIQGDEPLIDPNHIDLVVNALQSMSSPTILYFLS